jgi:hypothetical protein
MRERLAHKIGRLMQCANGSRSRKTARAIPEHLAHEKSGSRNARAPQPALQAPMRNRSVSTATSKMKSRRPTYANLAFAHKADDLRLGGR